MPNSYEKYHTIPEASKLLGLKEHALRRAVNNKAIPSYTPFGKRIRVRLSEIVKAIEEAQNV